MSAVEVRDAPENGEKPRPSQRELSPGQFSIGAMLLLTLWIAVCLALYRLSPIIGIALGLWTVPAAIRTLVVIQIWKPRVRRLSWGELYEVFGHSLILAATAEVGALIAFGVASTVCLLFAVATGLPPRAAIVAAIICGLMSGAAVVGCVLWFGRPSRFDRPV